MLRTNTNKAAELKSMREIGLMRESGKLVASALRMSVGRWLNRVRKRSRSIALWRHSSPDLVRFRSSKVIPVKRFPFLQALVFR